jgi:FecR protein
VQAGEDCREIARRVWPSEKDQAALDRLHALNPQLGPPPHNLKAGQVLRIIAPDPDAHVTFLKPAVNKRVLKEPEWQPAERGDGLYRLDEVNTLKGAGAEITFRDLSAVVLDENALVVIYGDQPVRTKAQKSGALELMNGDAVIKLSDLRGPRPLEVGTPAAQVSLGALGHAGVGVDEVRMSRVAVWSGNAEVAAQGKKVSVASGFGTRVESGKAPEAPAALPGTPEWTEGLSSAAFAVEGGAASVRLGWKPSPRAARYRVQVARDSLFIDHFIDRWVEPKETSLTAEVPTGSFFARVLAVDDRGLASPASKLFRLVAVAARARASSRTGAQPGAPAITAVGELRLVLEGPPAVKLAIDGQEPQEVHLPALVALLKPGRHELKAGAGAPGNAASLVVEVESPVAKVTLGKPEKGEPSPVELRFEDRSGSPLVLPQDENGGSALERLLKAGVVVLRDGNGAALAATVDGDLVRASVADPRSGAVHVRVIWAGVQIGEARR